MSRRIVDKLGFVTIYRDTETKEYVVRPIGDKTDRRAYFTEEKDDAYGTANHMDDQLRAKALRRHNPSKTTKTKRRTRALREWATRYSVYDARGILVGKTYTKKDAEKLKPARGRIAPYQHWEGLHARENPRHRARNPRKKSAKAFESRLDEIGRYKAFYSARGEWTEVKKWEKEEQRTIGEMMKAQRKKNPARVTKKAKKLAKSLVLRYGKPKARRIAGAEIGMAKRAKQTRKKKLFEGARKAINPATRHVKRVWTRRKMDDVWKIACRVKGGDLADVTAKAKEVAGKLAQKGWHVKYET